MMFSVDDDSFDRLAAEPGLLLLEFTAQWCPPCRAIAPLLERIAAERAGVLRVAVADLDASPGLAARHGVRGAPTLIVFQQGREVGRQLGAAPKAKLDAWLDRVTQR